MNSLYEYALKYADLGWPVFPLAPGKKTPITKSGVKDATVDKLVLSSWWEKWPDANIGLACGKGSGVWVVDIDINEAKGINGFTSLREAGCTNQATVSQYTPRGGLHLLFTATDPPRNKNSFLPGVDIRGEGYYIVLAPSHLDPYDGCPAGGEYYWAQDLDPWRPGLYPAQYPDCMRPKEIVKFNGTPLVYNETLAAPRQDTQRRISLYLATVDPAVQGLDGHGKLFWAAQCMVSGCRLSDEAAFSILASEYNPRCSPPWNLGDPSELKDFRRKITEARKNPPQSKRIGWIIDDDTYGDANITCTVDLESIMSAVREKEESALPPVDEAEEKRELEFLTRPTGLLGELCSWINAGAIRPQPLLTLACALTWLGALYGRKIEDERGGRTNIYCMGIARSSSGKDHAPRQIRRLALEMGGLGLIGGNDIASDTAIEERMSKAPSTLFLLDEIGHLLASINSGQDKNKMNIVSVLMRLYSCASDVYLGKEYADVEKQRIIVEPCCCLYGTSTPERFTDGVTPGEVRDGWLGRCLVFRTKEFPQKTDAEKLLVPQQLIDKCGAWLDVGRKETDGSSVSQYLIAQGDNRYSQNVDPLETITVKTTSDAKSEFNKLSARAESLDSGDSSSTIWLKAEENARRVALILAASDCPDFPAIDGRIADYACRLIRYLVKDFCNAIIPEIVENRMQYEKRRILAAIEFGKKNGASKRDVTRKSQWTNMSNRDAMIRDLLEAGEVAAEKEGKTIRFWASEWFLKREAASK